MRFYYVKRITDNIVNFAQLLQVSYNTKPINMYKTNPLKNE